MGKKRKHKDRDSSERLLRRIEKLEARVRKRRRTTSHSTKSFSRSPSPSTYSQSGSKSPKQNCYDESTYIILDNEGESHCVNTNNVNEHNVIRSEDSPKAPTQAPSTSPLLQDDDTSKEVTEPEHLDDDILNILGDAPKDLPIGRNIHNDVASRLRHVLENGLNKETKDKITEEYPIPENCSLFKAPELNDEIKAAVSELLLKKDSSLAARQGQVGTALSALSSAMDIIVTEKADLKTVLKHINDAARLLCDSHYIDTRMRRNFLVSTLNNKLKDTLKDSKRDKYLFSENLPEKLRANKAISKCGQDLKYIKPKSVATKSTAIASSTSNLNWKHPQPNPQQAHQRPPPTTYHRTAGPASSRRNDSARKTSYRANKNNAHYRYQQRRH